MTIVEQARQKTRDSWQKQIEARLQSGTASAQQILEEIQKDIDDLAA
jgi:hypothetical protein